MASKTPPNNLRRNALSLGLSTLPAALLTARSYELPSVWAVLLFVCAWIATLFHSLRMALRPRTRIGRSDPWFAAAGFLVWITMSVPPAWSYLADLSYVARYRSEWLQLVERVEAGDYPEWRFETEEPFSWITRDAILRRDPTSVVFALPGFLEPYGACFAWSEERPRPITRGGTPFHHLIGPWWRGDFP